jgi:hypothetical protein
MKLFKTTALALVAGAGLALVGAQAFAQSDNSAYTDTASISGNTEVNSFEGAGSSTQTTATQTEGSAIAVGIATPNGVGSGGQSLAGGTTTGAQTSNNIQPSLFGAGQMGVLNGANSTTQDGSTATSASNNTAVFVEASHAESQGSATTSDTGATGNSFAGLFVFGQTTAVSEDGYLADNTPVAPSVYVSSGDFNGASGAIALNQVAGVGNQQGNNLTTGLELSGANSTTVGSNTANVQGNQTLADAGDVEADYGASYETAYVDTNAFQNVTGAVSLNQAAGVANQQVNNMTLLH